MSRYCLDTCAYSRFRGGDPAIVDLIKRASWIGVPSIVIGELQAGFARGSRRAANEAGLAEFLSQTAVAEIVIDRVVAGHYAAIVTDLAIAGTPIPSNDSWVAACAAQAGAPVLTYDEHFRRVQRVGVILLK